MSRNAHFHSHEPLAKEDSLQLKSNKTTGPFTFLNPTRAQFQHIGAQSAPNEPTPGVEFKWTARNNRKGRHALVVDPDTAAAHNVQAPLTTSRTRTIFDGILRMFVSYPIWDVSYLVALTFTWGSIVWVINAFFVFLPLLAPSTTFPHESLTGGGVSAFIGATIFEVGSVLLMIEAVNENRSGCFGWALEQAISEHTSNEGQGLQVRPEKSACTHHHLNKFNLVGGGANKKASSENSPDLKPDDIEKRKLWVWFPSWAELKHHYFHELGFLACSSQMFGATVFWISGFTALPGILNTFSPGLEDGIYWTPQVIGGSGFIVSGTLFMIETQEKWWKPAFNVLGWHIGLWNLIGGIGFTLSPAFGYDTSSWAQFQASCSTFWGSWAFLIGSVIQLYESLEKYPVEVQKL